MSSTEAEAKKSLMAIHLQGHLLVAAPSFWYISTSAGRVFKTYAALVLGPAVAVLIWCFPTGLEPVQQKALAITALMIIYWIMEPIDHGLTALIGIYLFWATEVAEFRVAFSGFINSTTWFLFSSLLMGEAAGRTGLAKRVGLLVMSRVGSSPNQLLTGLLGLSVLLTFFVPSGMGRMAIIAPLSAGILQACGLLDCGNMAKGFFAVLTAFAGFSDVMILSGATTMMTHAILTEPASRSCGANG